MKKSAKRNYKSCTDIIMWNGGVGDTSGLMNLFYRFRMCA